MRIILLGAPASGKGSVGERIREEYGFPKISTGDLLREAVRKKTSLGLKAETQLGKGGLVDDDIVLGLLRERLGNPDCHAGYILDGFPRNLSQAQSLAALDGQRRELVFEIQVREDVLVKRISGRRICPSCEAIFNIHTKRPRREGICDVCGAKLLQRNDDRAELIPARKETYRTKTEPLTSYYGEKGILCKVDGNGTVEETLRPIKTVIDEELGKTGGKRIQL